MSEVYQKILRTYEENKQIVHFGGGVLLLWFLSYTPNERGFIVDLTTDYIRKHNPINAIYPAGKDTSDTNKLPIMNVL